MSIVDKLRNFIKKQSLNSTFFRTIIDTFKTLMLLPNYTYRRQLETEEDNQIIVMIDGKMAHGGMSDRLCGIISAYKYAKKSNKQFKIFWCYPYDLNLFLCPNLYDWSITNNPSYIFPYSRPKYISQFGPDKGKSDAYFEKKIKNTSRILHLYTNAHYFSREEFGILFHELFKPSLRLNIAVNEHIKSYGCYYSITFRFQQLLGDFKEDGFQTLSTESKSQLIQECLDCVEYVHTLNPGVKILVTSDSVTFLNIAKSTFDYILTNSGNIVHMDFVGKKDEIDINVHMKSYVDLYTLAHAKKIYLANFTPLYSSTFPLMASMIYNNEYYSIIKNVDGFDIV